VELLNIGFGNVLATKRVVCLVKAGSLPVKRLIDAAERQNRLIDATSGRRTRSVIVTDSNHIVLSHVSPASLAEKISGGQVEETEQRERAAE